MKFNCEVNVVDAIMGAGKSLGIMNYINNSNDDSERFLIITPFLNEIKRYQEYCPSKNLKEPLYKDSSKMTNLKNLIEKGENIISTHALFKKFDNELIDLCRVYNYTLIMDEVADVIEEHNLSKEDFQTLIDTYTNINPDTKQLIWKKEYSSYHGKFDEEKRLCELGSLVCYGDSLMVWLFPIEVFNSFRKIFILTYKFNLQLQRYYYDYYGLPYKYMSIEGSSPSEYHLVDYDSDLNYIQYDYSKLIHICENEKLNMIGDRQYDLSFSWYNRNKNNSSMKVLKDNIYNFFRYIRDSGSDDNLWTTFKEYQNVLKGKGYTKGFLAINARAVNTYKNRTSIAYLVNRYMNTYVKNFFTTNNITIDEDGYALSEMLQFIWRSAIRDGKEIWIYIPSIRMRTLLKNWIEENKLVKNNIETESE